MQMYNNGIVITATYTPLPCYYISAILYLLLQGVGDGSQPLISQYYGRDDRSSVQAVRKLAYLTACLLYTSPSPRD